MWRHTGLAASLIASAALATASSPPTSSAGLGMLPGDSNQFSVYDYRQRAVGAIDWPVTFVFTGAATVERVKEGLCRTTRHPWHYCDTGSTMYLFGRANETDSTGGFLSDTGVKRFAETCSTTEFTAHMRIYAPVAGSDAHDFTSAKYGHIVIATTHLDFQDHAGCSGRIHGYPDIAEKWFIEAMKTIPGWTIHPRKIDLGNGNEPYVVMRELSGVEVPHVYGNDRYATEVVIQ